MKISGNGVLRQQSPAAGDTSPLAPTVTVEFN